MRRDDRGSFEVWAGSRQQHLVRMAYLLTGDFHRAEDLVQEALVRAAMQWSTLRDGNPEAWVRTVIYRANVSWWRRQRREVLVDLVPDEGRPAFEPSDVVRTLLGLLTRQQRAVMLHRFVEDLSVADTARILDVSTGTVKKQTSLALQRLRLAEPTLSGLVEERR